MNAEILHDIISTIVGCLILGVITMLYVMLFNHRDEPDDFKDSDIEDEQEF